jgi:hypothetical protein
VIFRGHLRSSSVNPYSSISARNCEIWYGFASPLRGLQVQQPWNLRVAVEVMTAADPAECKPERFNQPAELGEIHIARVTRLEPLPERRSA